MTDFTSDYIEYILKAKALQEKWEPKVGDWYADPMFDEPVLIGDSRALAHAEAQQVQKWGTWLPTLHQLIEIIEGAGYFWSRWFDGSMTAHKCDPDGEEYDHIGPIKEREDMLAAAKLAVKVVENETN